MSGINLFESNKYAYESAVKMLSNRGKAAVIHPTGTGKSFIAFKLCEDNTDKKICWLSPSEYIFKTQCENVAATGAEVPQNIAFFTYAKLMLLSAEELAEIKPDYIILDEFHRCGAQMWGQGVDRLLNLYPATPLLGLSATNIRYLDNQRDMADELFDGNIASYMSLGEAIARGILQAPKYVVSLYSYHKQLEEYEYKVRNARSKDVRDSGQKILDALRRALDKADGLDKIFSKHIENKHGKYIVFCANKEHLDEMAVMSNEWFQDIDAELHIYKTYSDDPIAELEFKEFKEDKSEHLKLLFCIDMLNEGVHIDGIDGVILFRPTVSPIIYKQQIGRALSASGKNTPVIFDIVNNFESLYSIGAIEEEMQIAVSYYRSLGEENAIINEHFKITDELRDYRELFEELNDTLSASWDLMFAHAKEYYEKYGNLNVPRRYKTESGYSLGEWISVQRRVKSGKADGLLTKERISKLDEIGMIWESAADTSWNKYFNECKNYYAENGDLDINSRYVSPNGVKLGNWIANIRQKRKGGGNSEYLTPERISMLDSVGMIWNQPDYSWERNYDAAVKYYQTHGNLEVPATYQSDGVKLGAWIRSMRMAYFGKGNRASLTKNQIKQLEKIGMKWEIKQVHSWDYGFNQAKKYIPEIGGLNVGLKYVTPDGFALGKWLARQRTEYNTGKLSNERIMLLKKIGMFC